MRLNNKNISILKQGKGASSSLASCANPSFSGKGAALSGVLRNSKDKLSGLFFGKEIEIKNFDEIYLYFRCHLSDNFADYMSSKYKGAPVAKISKELENLKCGCDAGKLLKVDKVKEPALLYEEGVFEKSFKTFKYLFTGMPQDFIVACADRLKKLAPNLGLTKLLDESPLVVDRRKNRALKNKNLVARGILKTMDSAFEGNADICRPAKNNCGNCIAVTEIIDKKIAKAFTDSTGNYNTRDERALNRFVTSLIPSFLIGADAYNMSLKNGANDKEAKENGRIRRNQELINTGAETVSQFVLLGGFSGLVNSNPWGAPILNAVSSIASQVASRVSMGRPVLPVKIKNRELMLPSQMQDFISASKGGKVSDVPLTASMPTKDHGKNKEHFVSLRNGLKFCLASITAGFTLKFAGAKLSKAIASNDNTITRFINKQKSNIDNFLHEDLIVKKVELLSFCNIASNSGFKPVGLRWQRWLNDILVEGSEEQLVNLGKIDKTFNLFSAKISRKEALRTLAFPFTFAKEVLSFPYRVAQKVCGGVSTFKANENTKFGDMLKGWSGEPPKKALTQEENFLENMFSMYSDFTKRKEKFLKKNGDHAAFYREYTNYFRRQVEGALDEDNFSMIDNKKLGKMTQLLTMGTSTYFIVNDDYSQIAEQTGNEENAKHAGRERFVQKFVRVVAQIALMDIFNGVFKSQYTNSLLGATAVAAGTTVATDSATRVLSGKYIGKHTLEEQNEVDKKRENGAFSWYYKGIKKLVE